jgi:hypothetical protein
VSPQPQAKVRQIFHNLPKLPYLCIVKRTINQQYKHLKINKIMAQQNFMSARALTMTELENVNGGLSREAWYMFNKKEWMKLKKR